MAASRGKTEAVCGGCGRPTKADPAFIYCWADRRHAVKHVCSDNSCRVECREKGCTFGATLVRAA